MLSRRPRVGYAVCKSGHPMAPVTSYAAWLQQIAHLQVPEAEAQRLWREISRHRRELLRRLGRDVARRVAWLDFRRHLPRRPGRRVARRSPFLACPLLRPPQHADRTSSDDQPADAIERRAIYC